jgi:hypothetical protein
MPDHVFIHGLLIYGLNMYMLYVIARAFTMN